MLLSLEKFWETSVTLFEGNVILEFLFLEPAKEELGSCQTKLKRNDILLMIMIKNIKLVDVNQYQEP